MPNMTSKHIKIGITGQSGFIGTHLRNTMMRSPDKFFLIDFHRNYFLNDVELDKFCEQCDVIVHCASVIKTDDDDFYQTNVLLAEKLANSLIRVGGDKHLVMTSSLQEDKDTSYGKSKKLARELLAQQSSQSNFSFTGMIVPNVFGPFMCPYHNSVIATFCQQIVKNETPKIIVDNTLSLIYIDELVKEIIDKVLNKENNPLYIVPHQYKIKVSDLLDKLQNYKTCYQDMKCIPDISDSFSLNLFNTYLCYLFSENYFPVQLDVHEDERGIFSEIVKLKSGGQVSFSTTLPGVIRGNHYHTRKVERFIVVKGKAMIALRKIGTSEVLKFNVDGQKPAYVDIPIWHTHNIQNTGNDSLHVVFWINEIYNPDDSDTYFEKV